MRKTNVMQIVRLVMMIAAVAGVIYALEYMERGIAVWFWITLLGVGFVGLLYTFRLTQRRVRLERRAKERQDAHAFITQPPPAGGFRRSDRRQSRGRHRVGAGDGCRAVQRRNRLSDRGFVPGSRTGDGVL